MLEQMLDIEHYAFLFLNSAHSPFWDAFMYLISTKWSWTCVIIAFVIYLFYRKPFKEGMLVVIFILLCILVCDQLSSGIAKPYFTRFRPTHHPEYENIVKTVYGYRGYLYGFFSGHASNFFSVAMLTALIVRDKWYSIIVFSLASLVAYSRIYLGVHFISDILVGVVVGLIVGFLLYKLYRWVRLKWVSPKGPKETNRIFRIALPFWKWSIVGFIMIMLSVSAQVREIVNAVSKLN